MSVELYVVSLWLLMSFVQVIFGGRWRHLVGELELWERVGGVDIAFTPASFGQANTQVLMLLI